MGGCYCMCYGNTVCCLLIFLSRELGKPNMSSHRPPTTFLTQIGSDLVLMLMRQCPNSNLGLSSSVLFPTKTRTFPCRMQMYHNRTRTHIPRRRTCISCSRTRMYIPHSRTHILRSRTRTYTRHSRTHTNTIHNQIHIIYNSL